MNQELAQNQDEANITAQLTSVLALLNQILGIVGHQPKEAEKLAWEIFLLIMQRSFSVTAAEQTDDVQRQALVELQRETSPAALTNFADIISTGFEPEDISDIITESTQAVMSEYFRKVFPTLTAVQQQQIKDLVVKAAQANSGAAATRTGGL